MADGELRESVELPEYLEGIRELMRLPPKDGEETGGAADASAGAAGAGVRAGRPRQAAAWIALALVAIVVLVRTLHPGMETTLPAALEGVWRTNAPAYADRSLVITTSSLSFQVGEDSATSTRYAILRVRRSAVREGTLFRVDYLQNGGQLELSFVWRDSPQPEIRFANQQDLVWTRSGPAGPAAAGRPGT
jgi:hypothetical protein